jgi:hypothetical protein
MNYYLGGYYLISLIPYKLDNNKLIYTCSSCINDNLLLYPLCGDYIGKEEYIDKMKIKYNLNNFNIKLIIEWINNKSKKNQILWPDAFSDIKYAKEYKDKYFKNVKSIKLLAIYFSENETIKVLNEFEPKYNNEWEIGIYKILNKKILENSKELFLGYDLIGIDGGGDFHSFHCNSITKELSDKFGIELNNYGLFNNFLNWDSVLNYLNSHEAACEPVPWFAIKVKMVSEYL